MFGPNQLLLEGQNKRHEQTYSDFIMGAERSIEVKITAELLGFPHNCVLFPPYFSSMVMNKNA